MSTLFSALTEQNGNTCGAQYSPGLLTDGDIPAVLAATDVYVKPGVVEGIGLHSMQSRQAKCWEDSQSFGRSADDMADLGSDSIQIDEKKEEPEREEARSRDGFHGARAGLLGCHAVLLKGDFLAPTRE